MIFEEEISEYYLENDNTTILENNKEKINVENQNFRDVKIQMVLKVLQNSYKYSLLKETEMKILIEIIVEYNFFTGCADIRIEDLALKIKKTHRPTFSNLKILIDKGYLIKIKDGNKNLYRLSDKFESFFIDKTPSQVA